MKKKKGFDFGRMVFGCVPLPENDKAENWAHMRNLPLKKYRVTSRSSWPNYGIIRVVKRRYYANDAEHSRGES